MRRLLSRSLLLTFALLCGSLISPSPLRAATVAKSTVAASFELRIDKTTCEGSAVAISLHGETLLLTAGHVVERAHRSPGAAIGVLPVAPSWQPVWIYSESDGESHLIRGEVVLYSPCEEEGGLDLALIRPERPLRCKPVSLPSEGFKLRVGQKCYYCGSGRGIHRHLERSIVSRTEYVAEGLPFPFVLTNGAGWYGHSGSGLIVKHKGRATLAGVIVRIAGQHGKPPLLARTPDQVLRFLSGYKRGKMEHVP